MESLHDGVNGVEYPSYKQMKDDFEENHFMLENPVSFVCIEKNSGVPIKFKSCGGFKKRYAGLYCWERAANGAMKKKKFISLWTNDITRKTIHEFVEDHSKAEGVIHNPEMISTNKYQYNTWNSGDVPPAKRSKLYATICENLSTSLPRQLSD